MCGKMDEKEVGKEAARLEQVAAGSETKLADELHALCKEDRLAVARQMTRDQQQQPSDSLPKLDFYSDGDLKSAERKNKVGTVEQREYDDYTGKLIAKGVKDAGGEERTTYYETGMIKSYYSSHKDGSSIYTEFAPDLKRTSTVRNDGKGHREMVAFDPGSGNEVYTMVNDRLVRVKIPSGPDAVIAWDDNGNPHQFLDEPIKSLPPDFQSIPKWRFEQLDKDAKQLLDRYCEDGYLSFGDIAELQKDIVRRKDLTEVEKCQLYDLVQETAMDRDPMFDDRDENPAMVDSWKGNGDPWHAFAPISDKRHTKLVNMSPKDATQKIFDFEDSEENAGWKWRAARLIFGINEGDINASEGQLVAMRKLREKGTFEAYADEWRRQMLRRN